MGKDIIEAPKEKPQEIKIPKKDLGWVTQIDGKDVYRFIIDPTVEADAKGLKLDRKIKELKRGEN